jgi:hypothetical protein
MLAMMKSLSAATNDSSPTTASTGVTRRRMMVKKICACDAPSIFADSSISPRHRVEEALEQVGVHAERAAEVDHDEARACC